METMQPVLKSGRDVWDQVNMPKSEFLLRVKKIKQEMKKRGIRALLLYGHGQNDYGNPCYVSNYLVKKLRGGMAAITEKGEVTLFARIGSRDVDYEKITTWVEDVRSCDDVSRECVAFLKEKNLLSSTIGFVGLQQFMPNYQLQHLSAALGQGHIVDADHIIRDMRMLKSPRECDQIRRSARIVAHVIGLIANNLFPNSNEMILGAFIDREARLEGAEDVRILMAKPKDAPWAFMPPEDLPMAPGDTVIIYIAVEYERYWSEAVRTFAVKDSFIEEIKSEKTEALYGELLDGIKTDKPVSEFCEEARAKIGAREVDYIPEYGFGQGIGLSLQEFPLISEVEESLLREGMCLTLRLAVQDKAMGAVMAGNTIHLTKEGPEVLTD